jgi:hypothetical protein
MESERCPMVLAPNTAQPKDVICVLFSSKVPILLRRTQDGAFNVLGGCYVPGFMYGEAIDLLNSGELKMKTFKLV